MLKTRFVSLREVGEPVDFGDTLLLQYGHYIHPDNSVETGYRFIRKGDKGLKPQKGQARVPFLQVAKTLIERMEKLESTNYVSKILQTCDRIEKGEY
jgi:hypothetical protein